MKMTVFGGKDEQDFYTLMHEDMVVMEVDLKRAAVTVVNEKYLPFYLRGRRLTSFDFMEWLNRRIDNILDLCMNENHKTQQIGRDKEAILRDSLAVFVVDNYWIRFPNAATSWIELKRKRGIDCSSEVDSTAEIPGESGITLLDLPRSFQKKVHNGYILKRGDNAGYNFVASELGRVLGVNIVDVLEGSNGVVMCKIFTNENKSMVHAGELLHMTDYSLDHNKYRSLYEYFKRISRDDLARQLETLFLFNYLVINSDLHEGNMGILYDPCRFEFESIAPAYDFNNAFDAWDNVEFYDSWIIEKLPIFLKNNMNFYEKVQSAAFYKTLYESNYLTNKQKDCVWKRARYIAELVG